MKGFIIWSLSAVNGLLLSVSAFWFVSTDWLPVFDGQWLVFCNLILAVSFFLLLAYGESPFKRMTTRQWKVVGALTFLGMVGWLTNELDVHWFDSSRLQALIFILAAIGAMIFINALYANRPPASG